MAVKTNETDRSNSVTILCPSNVYAFIRVAFYIMASVFCFIFAIVFTKYIALAAIAFALVGWYKFLYIIYIQYLITNETITIRSGLIARRYDSLEMYRVKDYIVEQTVIMRIFKLMTVHLYTTDMTNKTLKLEGLPVSDIMNRIRELVQIARLRNRIFEIN